MGKKILFCANVDEHFEAFHLPCMEWLQNQGWEVHVAASGDLHLPCVNKKFNIPIHRSPFHSQNVSAYQKLKAIITENQYDVVHCHTPVGGVLSRLASRSARKQGAKVIYTAHGFHFCKGAPLLNWLLYYPIERGLSYYTDCLITINEEDYQLAINHRFQATDIQHIHGVGVNVERFKPVDKMMKRKLREKNGYHIDDFLMVNAAEFNKNKNQQLLIKSLAEIKSDVPYARLLLAGEGELMDNCRRLAEELEVCHMVEFLGFRKDMDELLPMCDIAVASSLREGLPVNVMEAMACGLPVIASKNRGHQELIHDEINGYTVGCEDVRAMADKMKSVAQSDVLKRKLGSEGRRIVESKYTVDKVLAGLKNIYSVYMNEVRENEGTN